MKKLLCVVPVLLLFVMIGAPNAHADSYAATFTCNPSECAQAPPPEDVSFPTPIIDINFPGSGFSSQQAVDASVTLPPADAPTDTDIWFVAAAIFCDPVTEVCSGYDTVGVRDVTNGQTVSVNTPVVPVPPVIGEVGGPLTFSPISDATPEPTPIILMLLGVGMLLMIRKRVFACGRYVA